MCISGIQTGVLLGILVMVGGGLTGAQAQDAIAALRNDYAGERAVCRVKTSELHATADLLGRPSEIRIVNGVISRGPSALIQGNRDVPIPAGQIVRVIGIEQRGTLKNDILRVTIEAAGTTIPIAFLQPKGSLGGMTEAQLQSLVAQVLEPVQRAAPSAQIGAGNSPRPQGTRAEPQRTPLPSENVLDLNGFLKTHNGDAILKIEGVHAAMGTPDNTRDNVIIDGVFQPRPVGGIYRGMRDFVLWPNSQVQFIQLAAFTDDEHDILHLVIRAAIGGFAPVSFLLPKGQLSTMSKKKILETIEPFVVFAAADSRTFRDESRTVAPATPIATGSLRPSHPPGPGCLWVPYVSKKFGLELLHEQCKARQNDWKPGDTAMGIGVSVQGPPQTLFEVRQKPASQPIETAIQEQIVAKYKDPAARAGCRVLRVKDEEQPGWHEYGIEAFGSYSHPKVTKEQEMEKGDGLCDGMSGADVTTVFVYNPEVSKTHFFAFYGLSDPLKGQPFDIFSLRFIK